jgi:hypothetical protein
MVTDGPSDISGGRGRKAQATLDTCWARLGDEYAVAGINVHATVDCHPDGLPAAISFALYRSAQEALLTHN